MFTNSSIHVAIAVLAVSTACGTAAAGDALFSGGSLVEKTENRPPSDPTPGENGLYGPAEGGFDESTLDARLAEAGFVPSVVDGERVIEITVGSAKASLQIDLVDDRLSFVLPLGPLDATRFRDVLEANSQVTPATFVLNNEEQRLELQLSIRHHGLTPVLLKSEIDRLGKVAAATAPAWKPAPPTSAKAPATAPSEQQPAQPAVPRKRTLNLVGRWVVGLPQGGGFVLKLEKTRKFELGHAKPDGEVDRSEGTFDLQQGQLVLVHGDGSKLAGKIAGIDENSFRFSTGSGDGLVFVRK